MFCMKCGTKLPDNAKFCFNCGASIPEGLGGTAPAAVERQVSEAPAQTSPPETSFPAVAGSHFTLLGRYPVELPQTTAIYNQLWAPFNREGLQLALMVRHTIRDLLKGHEVENPVEFSAQTLQYCLTACNPLFEKAVDFLIDHDIDYVTKEDLWDRLHDAVASTDLVKAMQEDNAAIEAYQKDLAVEKEADKASWKGGGFSITGAITGAIKASMMNTAQDALSSLGRSIMGNSYSDRLECFIRDRSAKRNYPVMAGAFISAVCRFDLFGEVYRLLVAEGAVPQVSFATSKADSRRKNLLERFANGKIEKEEVLEGLCRCLEVTGNTLPVYETLLELEPSAARDVFRMAEAEGEELQLARSVWGEYMNKKKAAEKFHIPDWLPTFLSRSFFLVSGPAMLTALLVQLRELPRIFYGEERTCINIALSADTYWIPANVENVCFWGMGKEVKLALDNPGDTDWNGHNVHFHLVKFIGPAEAWARHVREQELQEAQEDLLAGAKERALQAFQLAGEMGSAEAFWQLANLYKKKKQEEDAQWALVESAVLGKREAALVMYLLLKEKQHEQRFVYRKLAAEGAQTLVAQGKYDEAKAWYEKLVEEKDGTACLFLGQMASRGQGMEKDEALAMEWFEKAKSYGCEEAGAAIGALAFELGQRLEDKAGTECGEQAQADWQQAWHYYQWALSEKDPDAEKKIRALGLQVGKAMEAQGEAQKALEYYQEALELGNQEALLRAARLCADPRKETFDLTEAWHLYRKAAQDAEKPEDVEQEWDCRKALVPLTLRVACLTEVMADQMEKAAYYYIGERIAAPLDNAMKSYGSRAGVQPDQVVILCDSTHSLFWGQGEQGFLITRDGQFISSLGIRISLDQLGPVKCSDEEAVAITSGTVLVHFKGQQAEDQDFCNLLNEIVLPPRPTK